ncbi:MAG: DsbA family protein [Arcanobacterium sp.]|nr:DsbA family protein [Arcanobacterium sp.]
MRQNPVRELIYVADAYCGWCYGFSKTITTLARDPELSIRVMHGSLFSGDRALPISSYPHIPGANKRITELTGAKFGAGYLRRLESGDLRIDSSDAARGLMALRAVAGKDRGVEALAAMQKAFYGEGHSLSEEAAYIFAAHELGINSALVLVELNNPENAFLAQEEQKQVYATGISHYPALLAITEVGLVEIGSPTATPAQIKAELAQI